MSAKKPPTTILPNDPGHRNKQIPDTSSERRLPALKNVELRSDGAFSAQQAPSSDLLSAVGPPVMPDTYIELEPGMLIGDHYEIKSRLGSGGMGAVFHVHNRQSQADRALKALHSEKNDDLSSVARFKNEIEALAKLRHPGLVRLYDAGRSGDYFFYTMDLLVGGDLHDKLDQHGPIEEKQALSILRTIAEAVGCIHQAGLMHRDLKSENIVFDDMGRPVVVDFGLVLRMGLDPGERLTSRGRIIGSVHYMAPEQVQRPHDIDHRCDIYALGVLLYEMLTGDPPFAEKHGSEVLVDMLSGKTPPLKQLSPSLSPGVVALCEKAMALIPQERYQNTQELCDAIAILLDEAA